MDLTGFKKIPDYPDYYINKNGVVYSDKVRRRLTVHKNSVGYSYVTFTYDRNRTNILLHRLLAYMFMGMDNLHNTEYEVHHIDGNIENNKIDNLEVLTVLEHRAETLINQNKKIRDPCIRKYVQEKYTDCDNLINTKQPRKRTKPLSEFKSALKSRYNCKCCGTELTHKRKTLTCADCILLDFTTCTVVIKPQSLEDFNELIKLFGGNWCLIGRVCGVSDNALRKRYNRLANKTKR